MATFNSIGYANAIANPIVNNPGFIINAEEKISWFDYFCTGVEATGDVIVLARVPANVRLKIGQIMNTAAGTGAALVLSLKSSAKTLSSSISMSSIAQNTFANTLALNFGYITNTGIAPTSANQNYLDAQTIAVPPVGQSADYDLLIATVTASTVLTANAQITGYLGYSALK